VIVDNLAKPYKFCGETGLFIHKDIYTKRILINMEQLLKRGAFVGLSQLEYVLK